MNSKLLVPLFTISILLAPTPFQDTAGAAGAAVDPAAAEIADRAQRLHQHLQQLDRLLRNHLLRVERLASEGRPADPGLLEEIEGLRRHLRSLEAMVHGWDPDEKDMLRSKVRALRPLVEVLERAANGHRVGVGESRGPGEALRPPRSPEPYVRKIVPGNDDCADATPIGFGTFFGDTTEATSDGESCYGGSPDVWFRFSSPTTTEVFADTRGSSYDTVLSVHAGCPGTEANQIACNDDASGGQSRVGFHAEAGAGYLIRVAGCCGNGGSAGRFTLNVGPAGSVSGTVTDEVTGEPIPGVRIAVWAEHSYSTVGSAQTGAGGDYEVEGLPRGS